MSTNKSEEMKRIGVFGGTFDPIHFGHLMMAQTVKEELKLDKILFIPARNNPFKHTQKKKERQHSYEMIEKAIADNPDFGVSMVELNREGKSYTYDTIKKLQEEEEAEYYFLIGTDLIYELQNWYRAEDLFNMVTFVVVGRPDREKRTPDKQITYLREEFGANIIYCRAAELDISSTAIRNRVRLGKSIKYYTPKPVIEYIKDKNLYKEKNKESKKIQEYKNKLKKLIKPGRYDHSIGVMETAVKLAELYNADIKKAQIAGLLHDCAKSMTVPQMLDLAEEEGLELSKSVKNNTGTMHAPVGQLLAKREFGIDDPDILSAIACHTTGKPDMNKLDKIIFLADYIEPGRRTEGVEEVREIARRDLDEAVLACLDRTIAHLTSSLKPINPVTIKTRNALLKQIKSGTIV